MMKQSNPRIRFKEFNNKWGNYKLGQLGTFKSGIGFSDSQQGGTEGIPFFKVSDMNNIGNETEMRNANNYVTQEQIMKNSWKVINETPAIIFAKVGAALMLNRKRLVTRPFLIDNNTMSYSFDELWDKDFGLTLFQTINLPKYAQIGALPSYNASDIAMIKVNVPDVQEQSAIGSLFRTLDDLLTNYKDNLANYQSLKASMLSKMFPKAGQTVPEIRLDGFEGEWEKGTIGEFGSFYYGKSAPKWSVTDEATTPCVRYGELYTKFSTKIDKIYSYTSIPKENLKLSSGNEVLVPRVGEDPLDFANCSWLSLKGVAIGEMISVYNTPNNPLFIAYYFNAKMKKEFAKRVEGGSVANLYYTYLENISISVPSLPEQQAIGAYFSNLDNLISSHQEKISQLEILKKKLLQDMFI